MQPPPAKCLKCGGILFERVLLDNKGHTAMDQKTALQLQTDEHGPYFKCPHCSAKNAVVHAGSSDGLPQTRISHIRD